MMMCLNVEAMSCGDRLKATNVRLSTTSRASRSAYWDNIEVDVLSVSIVTDEILESFLVSDVFDTPLDRSEPTVEVEDLGHQLDWRAAFPPGFENNCFTSWTDACNHNRITIR